MRKFAFACTIVVVVVLSLPSAGWGYIKNANPPDIDKGPAWWTDPAYQLANDMTCWLATASNLLAAAGWDTEANIYHWMIDEAGNIPNAPPWDFGHTGWCHQAMNAYIQTHAPGNPSNPYNTVQTYYTVMLAAPNGPLPAHDFASFFPLPADTRQFVAQELRSCHYVGVGMFPLLPNDPNFIDVGHCVSTWGDPLAAGAMMPPPPASVYITDSDRDVVGDYLACDPNVDAYNWGGPVMLGPESIFNLANYYGAGLPGHVLYINVLVPEPVTLLLLALGGLAVMRRR